MRFRLHYVHVITYDVTNVLMFMLLNRLNRLHYGFDKFIYFCFQQKKIACIIEIIEIKLCHFFLSCTLCHFFLCHFFLVPFYPVPFCPVPFFQVPFFPTLVRRSKQVDTKEPSIVLIIITIVHKYPPPPPPHSVQHGCCIFKGVIKLCNKTFKIILKILALFAYQLRK